MQERRLLSSLVEGGACPQPAGDRRRDAAQRLGPERAAAGRVLGRRANVGNALQRRLGGHVDEGDRLGGERLPPRDLVGVGGGNERARELLAVRRGSGVRKSLDERGELERFEGAFVHAASVRAPSAGSSRGGWRLTPGR